jgi:succinate-acetate transporter protein
MLRRNKSDGTKARMEAKNTAPMFGEPTPLGLLGLAIGCAALLPVAFGHVPKDPTAAAAMLETSAWFCLVFGAGCQFLAGLMCLANKNTLGGTLFTTFSFNWVMNFWALDRLAHGKVPDVSVVVGVDCAFLVIFVVLSFAFALVSKLLFVFLLDIDVLYALRIVRHFEPSAGLGLAIAMATVALAALALYVALALLVNDAAGRALLPMGGPLLRLAPPREEAPRDAPLRVVAA